MADHGTPTGSNLYVDYTAKLKARHDDLLLQLDPAYTTPTNVPTNTVRFSSAAAKWQKWNGTSWVDLITTYSISTSGNASTATALATARTVGGVSFDGTANINLPGVNIAGNQSTTGNASTATALATARTIGGVSFDGTTNINLPGVNTAGNQSTTGNAATATLAASATLAVALSTNRSTYKGVTDGSVVGQLMWKNYGNSHTIFDASAGTSPDGSAVNNTNPTNYWSGAYPTLMGWNGVSTYGVRVDSSRTADGVPFLPAGTRMPFAQASAPTGWTQDASDSANNRMLRVVSGVGGGVGGAYSPIINSVVPAHTHGFSTGTVSSDHSHGIVDPGHSHTYYNTIGTGSAAGFAQADFNNKGTDNTSASTTGIYTGGISANHYHSGSTDNGSSQTNWTPRYIDMIICTKA